MSLNRDDARETCTYGAVAVLALGIGVSGERGQGDLGFAVVCAFYMYVLGCICSMESVRGGFLRGRLGIYFTTT